MVCFPSLLSVCPSLCTGSELLEFISVFSDPGILMSFWRVNVRKITLFAHHSLTPAVLALCIALIFLTYYTKKLRRYGGEDVSPHPSKPRTFYIIQSVWMALCTHRWKVSPPYLYSELDIFSIQFWVFWDKIQHPMPFIPPLFNLISRRTKGVATRRLHTEPKLRDSASKDAGSVMEEGGDKVTGFACFH